MGFQFAETMVGTVEWDAAPGVKQPFRFDVTATAESALAHLRDGKAALHGVVHAPPVANASAAEGIITIRPVDRRIIRYELEFTTDAGARYVLVGQKTIRWLHARKTFTYLPAEILDDAGARVGRSETYFDLETALWPFLRSFRPI